MFVHRFQFLGTEGCGRRHEAAADARACEEQIVNDFQTAEYEAQVGVCPHCDGLGHRSEASCPMFSNEIAHYEGIQDQLREAGLVA